MPNETQTGRGILYGITNSGGSITLTGVAGILDSSKISHKFKLENIEDELGFTAAQIATDPHLELDVVWTATGASRSAAAASAAILAPLSKVTLANFKVAAFNGDWSYQGDQSIDLSHKAAKLMLKLKKWDDAAQNTALTTVIDG